VEFNKLIFQETKMEKFIDIVLHLNYEII